MEYEVNFGRLGRAPRTVASGPGAKFRLALLGDFSGRANAGTVETGAALASRKPIKVDVDNLDTVLAKMKVSLALPLAEDGGTIAVPIGSMDDFHPDQLAENLDLFAQLRDLRRNLSSRTGFDRAAKQVLAWSGEAPLPRPHRRARGAAVATDRKLSDFARLTGRRSTAEIAEAEADDLIRRLVGPFIVPARDSRQDALIARVDEALSAAMRRVLHHPDFQTAEALWRGVEFLVRRIETGARMEIVLYDVSAEELAADLAASDTLEDSGLYGMLVEQPSLDAHQGAFAAVIGLYMFELTPPHADLLGRIAQIAAGGGAPFISAIAPDPLKEKFEDQHPMIQDAWTALQGLPAARYLGLVAPRFLMRLPYGKKTDPIDAFAFEEFTRQEGLAGMLWGHPALVPALLLTETFVQQGAKMRLGTVMGVGDMAYYVYIDEDGEQVALPCTERLWSERQAVHVSNYRVMPLLSLRGRPEVRLGSFASLAGTTLAGFWPPPDTSVPEAPTPESEPQDESDSAEAASDEEETPSEDSAATETDSTEDSADAPAEGGGDTDLDALLAGLNAEPEAPAAGETEPDLDALLASLK